MRQATEQRTADSWMVLLAAVSIFTLFGFAGRGLAKPTPSDAKSKIFAQKLVEDIAAKHPELQGISLATNPPGTHICATIADTKVNGVGKKCEKEHQIVIETGKSIVHKNGEGYEVTLPFQLSGKTIGIIGMEFKLDQQEAGLLDRAEVIAKEVEDQVLSKPKLFGSPADAKRKIFAQKLVEDTAAKHPELLGVALATNPPDGHDCVTIADTQVNEVGDKCEKEDLIVMKTGKSIVQKDGEDYEVTLPFQLSGKTIGVIGMDFKLDQQETGLLDHAEVIAKEVEDQVLSKSKLFKTAK